MIQKPQTIAADVSEMIRHLARTAGTHAMAKAMAVSILDECTKLQKVDVVLASLFKANIYALTGELEEVERWFKNAEQNRAPPDKVDRAREIVYFLTGQISKAYPYFDGLERSDPAALFNKAMSCGWFDRAVSLANETANLAVPAAIVALARQAQSVAKELDLTELLASQIMDQVHGTMVGRGLIWLDVCPSFTVLDLQHGGPAIHITFRIADTPGSAAELSWDLASKLAAKRLDDKGLLVSYQGTVLQKAQESALV